MRATVTAFLALALAGCALEPLEGTRLFDGVAEPRTEYDLVIRYVPAMQTDNACRELFVEADQTPPPRGLVTFMACTWTQADAEIAPGELPWCRVVLPEGVGPGDPMYEHEMDHCEGWDDIHHEAPEAVRS